jgi:hypothetical protein
LFSARYIFAGVGNLCQFKRFKRLKGFLKVLVIKKITLGAEVAGYAKIPTFCTLWKRGKDLLWGILEIRGL